MQDLFVILLFALHGQACQRPSTLLRRTTCPCVAPCVSRDHRRTPLCAAAIPARPLCIVQPPLHPTLHAPLLQLALLQSRSPAPSLRQLAWRCSPLARSTVTRMKGTCLSPHFFRDGATLFLWNIPRMTMSSFSFRTKHC